jgi:16S rRNA (guanine(966)-N(2))-methyltransferase RsmD
MRVIAGQAKGRKLIAPAGLEIRPTADRMKEALFSAIGEGVCGCDFLDLFSGSGAIGIEALSRGAKSAVFIDRESLILIKSNIVLCGFQDRSAVIGADCEKAVMRLGRERKEFDIAFLDPPYNKNLVAPTVGALLDSAVIKPGGLIIVECASGELGECGGLQQQRREIGLLKTKKYASTAFAFYVRLADA